MIFPQSNIFLPGLKSRFSAPDTAHDSGNVLERMWSLPPPSLSDKNIIGTFPPKPQQGLSPVYLSCFFVDEIHNFVCNALMFKKVPCVNIWYGNNNLCSMNKLLHFYCPLCSVTTSRWHESHIWMFRFK